MEAAAHFLFSNFHFLIFLPITKIFRVKFFAGLRGSAADEHHRLAGNLDALPAFAAGHEVIHADHVRAGVIEFLAVFGADATRRRTLFCAHHPTDGIGALLAAARAIELQRFLFLSFVVKESFVHDSCQDWLAKSRR